MVKLLKCQAHNEKDKFDIAGFAVGIVEKNKILNRNKIKKGDLIFFGAGKEKL